ISGARARVCRCAAGIEAADGPVCCRAGGAATDRDRCGGGENFEKVALAMKTIHTIVELRAQIAAWRAAGERIALTPTMGNLHRGHLRLVEAGHAHAPDR